MNETEDAHATQRLDKWLWHARIVKTRSLSAELVAQGKVRINREKILKPAHPVKSGDVITAALFGRVRVLQIDALSDRRVPASRARTLYLDLTPPADPRPSALPDNNAGTHEQSA